MGCQVIQFTSVETFPQGGGGQPNFIKLQKNAFSEIRCSLQFELWAWLEQKSGLEFSGDGTAGYMVEKVKIVSVHVRYFSFFSFFQFLQFRSVSLSQVTSGYIRLRQFTLEGRDVELDKMWQSFWYKYYNYVAYFPLL